MNLLLDQLGDTLTHCSIKTSWEMTIEAVPKLTVGVE